MSAVPPSNTKPVALVTGAGSGIGRATAIALSGAGWRLGLLGRTGSKLESTIEILAPDHPDAIALTCDLADAETTEASVQTVLDHFGRLDAVVNVAGISPQVPIDSLDAELLHSVLAQNLVGHVLIVSRAWRSLVESRGCVVNISSMASVDPFQGFTAYAASKSGLDSLTRSIMAEAADTGIRAFTLNPGAVETPLLRSLFDESVIGSDATLAPEVIAQEILDCINGDRDHRVGGHFPMVHPFTP